MCRASLAHHSPSQHPLMDPATQTALRLVVESGLHRTASCRIPIGETRVGAALDTDVGVSDLGVPVGFVIRRTAGAVRLAAVDANLDFNGKALRPGRERALGRTTTFTSGGVRFRLEVSKADASSRHARVVAGVVIGAAAFTLAFATHTASLPDLDGLGRAASEATSAIPTVPSPTSASAKPEPSIAELLGGLRRQVSSAGIETLAFRQQADGAIAAVGTIAPPQKAAWHEIGRWFDAEARGRFVLVDDVKVADPAPVLQIQAVWPGRNPYVVDGNGQKLFVGSILSSGWVIRSIDKSRVLIQRDEQIVAVRF